MKYPIPKVSTGFPYKENKVILNQQLYALEKNLRPNIRKTVCKFLDATEIQISIYNNFFPASLIQRIEHAISSRRT